MHRLHGLETINEITSAVIGAAYKIHSALGPGLLESSYKECLAFELRELGLLTEKEKPLPLIYKNIRLELGYRVDLMIEKTVIVEIKAVDLLAAVHTAQVLTYLKLSGCRVGLLINFHTADLKKGIKRLIL